MVFFLSVFLFGFSKVNYFTFVFIVHFLFDMASDMTSGFDADSQYFLSQFNIIMICTHLWNHVRLYARSSTGLLEKNSEVIFFYVSLLILS